MTRSRRRDTLAGMKIAALILLAAGAAHAQYRCEAPDGSTSFQQAPCPAGTASKRLELPPPATERPEHIRRAIAERRVVAGMTREEVERAAGRAPDHVTTSVAPEAIRRQLVYRFGGRTLYIYTVDDIVESFTEAR